MRMTFFAIAAALLPAPLLADTLISHVNGIQVGSDGKLQHFNGLLIDDQGKVKEVLNRAEAYKAAKVDVIDGQGRTLMPGFIDAHGHVIELGAYALELDLVGTKSLAELQQRLRD